MSSAAPTADEMPGMKKNVALLSASLALSMSGNVLIVAVAALAGRSLDPEGVLWTLPLTFQFLGVMISTIPANLLMKRIGRKWGFTIGQFAGLIGGLLSFHAIMEQNFALFSACGLLFGIHAAFWNYMRFAAADVSTPEFRSRAISYVMAGGVVAAILGPELSKFTYDLFAPVTAAGCYLAIAGLCAVTIVVIQFQTFPPRIKTEGPQDKGRPLREITRQPLFIIAVLSAMVGYAAMNLVMTATPLAMLACGFVQTDSAFVIQWHALGMFAPSFFTGHLIRRFGNITIISIGTLFMFLAVAINLMGIEKANFLSALILLGLGWNFMFIGGTTLLTNCYRPEEQHKVQGFNDFLVFGLMIITSLSAGLLQSLIGWTSVNLAVVLPLMIVTVAILWLKLSGHTGRQPA